MRPILLGMNNPLSRGNDLALYPYPARSAGGRLCAMFIEQSGLTRRHYIKDFDRRNLVSGLKWSNRVAVQQADELIAQLRGTGATVVVLGQQTAWALDLPPLLFLPQTVHGVTWRQVPHPSGRNRWYNDELNRAVVGLLLTELHSQWERNHAGATGEERVRGAAAGR